MANRKVSRLLRVFTICLLPIVTQAQTNFSGSSSRKLPASVSSTSFDSCGEAESIVTARGTLFPAAMAMILVPLPRLVLPTARPPFSQPRSCRRSNLRPDSAFLLGAVSRSVCATLSPTGRSAPTAGTVHARFGTADTCWAIPAIAPRCAESTALRSIPHACQPAAGRACRHAEETATAAPAPPNPHPTPLPALAFVVPQHRQCHLFCAVICTKTQAQNNLSYLSDRF